MEQTNRSLARYLVEEAYEVIDAIERHDAQHFADELGDVLLQVVFQSEIADCEGLFDIDDVLAGINRGHTVQEFTDAVAAVRRRGIDVAVHLICGLPGDTRENFVATAAFLSGLGGQGVKLHHLHVVAGSGLEPLWRRGEVRVPEYPEYVGACTDFLELLCPDVAVLRLVGTATREVLLAPLWGKGGREVSRDVAAELHRRGTWQGCRRY